MSKPSAPNLTSINIPRKGEAQPATPSLEPSAAQQPPTSAKPAPLVRTTVSTRLTLDLQKRLRRCAYETEEANQDIIEKALNEYLRKNGF